MLHPYSPECVEGRNSSKVADGKMCPAPAVRYSLCTSTPMGDDERKRGTEMSEQISQQNKALARRWFEDLFSRGDLDAANEILSVDFVDHLTHEDERGLEELKHYVTMYRTTFPDIQDTVEEIVAEGDKDRKSTRLNSSHANISYAVFCLKKKPENTIVGGGSGHRLLLVEAALLVVLVVVTGVAHLGPFLRRLGLSAIVALIGAHVRTFPR